MSKHTPGPWRFEPGGGHAPNRIVGSESRQTLGWPEPRGGVSNASYSDRVCENLGDPELPTPAANIRLIAAAPEIIEWLRTLHNAMIEHEYGGGYGPHSVAQREVTALLARIDGDDDG